MFDWLLKMLFANLYMRVGEDGGGDALDGLGDGEDTDTDTDVTTGDDAPDTDVTTGDDKGKGEEQFAGLYGAPEDGYGEFALPEGIERDAESEAEFHKVAASLNLSQDGAQKLVDWVAQRQSTMTKAVTQAIEQEHQNWKNQVRADPEIGGAHLKESLATARRGLSAIDPNGELNEVLRASKLGSHPAVVRALVRAGKAVGEASHQGSGEGGGSDQRDLADKLFTSMSD